MLERKKGHSLYWERGRATDDVKKDTA
jgi:hypothetical protein